jgi:hypothetical protein
MVATPASAIILVEAAAFFSIAHGRRAGAQSFASHAETNFARRRRRPERSAISIDDTKTLRPNKNPGQSRVIMQSAKE